MLDIKIIKDLYEKQELTGKEIAVMFNTYPQKIYRFLHKNNITLREAIVRPLNVDIQILKIMYEDNKLSYGAIAKKVSINRDTLRSFMKKNGIKGRKNYIQGKESPNWKQDKAGYVACHSRLNRVFGKPKFCDECGTTTAKQYDWANMTGNYQDIHDFIRLCKSCHLKYDNAKRRETMQRIKNRWYLKCIRLSS